MANKKKTKDWCLGPDFFKRRTDMGWIFSSPGIGRGSVFFFLIVTGCLALFSFLNFELAGLSVAATAI